MKVKNGMKSKLCSGSLIHYFFLATMILTAGLLWAGQSHTSDAVSDGTAITTNNNFNTNPTYLNISPRKNQSLEQQETDQLECFEWATEYLSWDPYVAYAELVDQGYAVALTQQQMEEGLVCLAMDGIIAASIVERLTNTGNDPINNETAQAAAIGAAIGAALGTVNTSFLHEPDDPDAQRAVSRFERDLSKWEQKYSGCLKRKGYRIIKEDD